MGKVGILNNNGTLNLRLTWQGKTRKISLGVRANRKNRAWAELKAAELEFAQTQPDFDLNDWKEKLRPDRQPPPPKTLTIVEIWEAYAKHRRHLVQESTFNRSYGFTSSVVERLQHQHPSDAVAIRNELLKSYSPESARRQLEQLNAACRWAVEEKRIEANPFEGLKIEKPKRSKIRLNYSQQSFTAAERDAIINAFYSDRFSSHRGNVKSSYYADAVAWAFNTGVRPEELWAIRLEHCRGGKLIVCQAMPAGAKLKSPKSTKTQRVRELPLNAELEAILSRRKAALDEGLLFPAPRSGGYVDYWNFCSRHWKRTLTGLIDAGEVSRYLPPKCMRHTFATLAIYKGMPIHVVADWIGDDRATLIAHYAGVVGDLKLPSRQEFKNCT